MHFRVLCTVPVGRLEQDWRRCWRRTGRIFNIKRRRDNVKRHFQRGFRLHIHWKLNDDDQETTSECVGDKEFGQREIYVPGHRMPLATATERVNEWRPPNWADGMRRHVLIRWDIGATHRRGIFCGGGRMILVQIGFSPATAAEATGISKDFINTLKPPKKCQANVDKWICNVGQGWILRLYEGCFRGFLTNF